MNKVYSWTLYEDHNPYDVLQWTSISGWKEVVGSARVFSSREAAVADFVQWAESNAGCEEILQTLTFSGITNASVEALVNGLLATGDVQHWHFVVNDYEVH